MHSNSNIDSTTGENKALLGLQDGESSARDINKETFVKDFQEINSILRDLNKEVSFK